MHPLPCHAFAAPITLIGVSAEARLGPLYARLHTDAPHYRGVRLIPLSDVKLGLAAARVVRADGPIVLRPALINVVHKIDPRQPLSNVRPLTVVLGAAFARHRFNTLLMSVFAGVRSNTQAIRIAKHGRDIVNTRIKLEAIRIPAGADRA